MPDLLMELSIKFYCCWLVLILKGLDVRPVMKIERNTDAERTFDRFLRRPELKTTSRDS